MPTYAFNDEKEAEDFIKSMAEKDFNEHFEEIENVSHTVIMDNYRGLSDKRYIGARMWVYEDDKVYVHVKRSLLEGETPYYGDISEDPGKAVKKYNFYYSWFNKRTQQWEYKPNVLERTASPGRYFPQFGIAWAPANEFTQQGIVKEDLVEYTQEKEYKSK